MNTHQTVILQTVTYVTGSKIMHVQQHEYIYELWNIMYLSIYICIWNEKYSHV